MKTSVMFLFMVVGALMLTGSAAASKNGNTIVDVAISVNSEGPYAGSFDTLIAGLVAADPAVLNTLSSRGQYTVFAPTDDAFAKLGLNEGNIATALDQKTLTNVLLYHVTHGRRMSDSVLMSDEIRMLDKGFVSHDEGVLTDENGGESNIIVADVKASNGIIHVIDSVLLPE